MDGVARNQLKWLCRRGLLELDLVFEKFIPTLRDEDVQPLFALLELPDNQLWDIISGRSDAYDRRFEQTVARLRPDRCLGGYRHGRQNRNAQASRRQEPRVPGAFRQHGPRRGGHPHALRQVRDVHLRPGVPVDRELQLGDHLHRRRQGNPPLPRLPHRAARAALRLPRGVLPALVRRASQPQAEGRVRRHRHAPHHGARATRSPVPGVPARCPPDGGDGRRGGRPVGVLSRRARHQQSAAPRDLGVPADRQDADHRRDVLQVLDRPAVHLSEERPLLHRELHAHDVRRADRGVQGEPGAGARARPHLHPACGPRAERLHLDGAPVRLLRREPLRLHRRGHRGRSGARRTAARTRPAWRCWRRSATRPRSPSSSAR